MGYASYSVNNRAVRSAALHYDTKPVNEIFEQNKAHRIHKEMDPKDAKVREACDSAAHPNSTPIQLWLDFTGSMGHIPHEMIKEGLPTLIGTLIQNGVPDVALMFGGIGDHTIDRAPLQISQFESGDAELDMWLTRSWLEGGGGGNEGESYLLAWYFSAFHTRTDAWDKRHKKGFLFTVGDEPCLENLPISAVKGLMGSTAVGQGNYTRAELLALAQEKNHVYHLFIVHDGRRVDHAWRELLGDHLIELTDYRDVSKKISEIVLANLKAQPGAGNIVVPLPKPADPKKDEPDQTILL